MSSVELSSTRPNKGPHNNIVELIGHKVAMEWRMEGGADRRTVRLQNRCFYREF